MLKLNASYSKKIPVDGTDFSSHSYHASVEVEIPDGLTPGELQNRIHETFELVRTSVETELNGNSRTSSERKPRRMPERSEAPASEKQLSYLRDIAVQHGMTLRQLDAEAHDRYGVGTARELSKSQASRLIDTLAGVAGKTGRKAA